MGFLDTGSLPTGKLTLRVLPANADPLRYVTSTEWNTTMSAMLDARLGIIATPTIGFTPQGSRPAAWSNGGAVYRAWVRDSDKHLMYYNGTSDVDLNAGAAPDLSTVYANGAAGPQVLALDTTRDGMIIRDNATPIGSTLFGVQNSSATVKMLDVLAAGVAFGVAPQPVADIGAALGLINKRWLGLFNGGVLSGGLETNANASFIMTANKWFVSATNSAARTITLISANTVPAGTMVVIKDGNGNAGTNNVTVNRAGADTIDGATSKVISTNYGTLRLVSDGSTAWLTW